MEESQSSTLTADNANSQAVDNPAVESALIPAAAAGSVVENEPEKSVGVSTSERQFERASEGVSLVPEYDASENDSSMEETAPEEHEPQPELEPEPEHTPAPELEFEPNPVPEHHPEEQPQDTEPAPEPIPSAETVHEAETNPPPQFVAEPVGNEEPLPEGYIPEPEPEHESEAVLDGVKKVCIDSDSEDDDKEELIKNFGLMYSDHNYDPPEKSQRTLYDRIVFPPIGNLDEFGNIQISTPPAPVSRPQMPHLQQQPIASSRMLQHQQQFAISGENTRGEPSIVARAPAREGGVYRATQVDQTPTGYGYANVTRQSNVPYHNPPQTRVVPHTMASARSKTMIEGSPGQAYANTTPTPVCLTGRTAYGNSGTRRFIGAPPTPTPATFAAMQQGGQAMYRRTQTVNRVGSGVAPIGNASTIAGPRVTAAIRQGTVTTINRGGHQLQQTMSMEQLTERDGSLQMDHHHVTVQPMQTQQRRVVDVAPHRMTAEQRQQQQQLAAQSRASASSQSQYHQMNMVGQVGHMGHLSAERESLNQHGHPGAAPLVVPTRGSKLQVRGRTGSIGARVRREDLPEQYPQQMQGQGQPMGHDVPSTTRILPSSPRRQLPLHQQYSEGPQTVPQAPIIATTTYSEMPGSALPETLTSHDSMGELEQEPAMVQAHLPAHVPLTGSVSAMNLSQQQHHQGLAMTSASTHSIRTASQPANMNVSPVKMPQQQQQQQFQQHYGGSKPTPPHRMTQEERNAHIARVHEKEKPSQQKQFPMGEQTDEAAGQPIPAPVNVPVPAAVPASHPVPVPQQHVPQQPQVQQPQIQQHYQVHREVAPVPVVPVQHQPVHYPGQGPSVKTVRDEKEAEDISKIVKELKESAETHEQEGNKSWKTKEMSPDSIKQTIETIRRQIEEENSQGRPNERRRSGGNSTARLAAEVAAQQMNPMAGVDGSASSSQMGQQSFVSPEGQQRQRGRPKGSTGTRNRWSSTTDGDNIGAVSGGPPVQTPIRFQGTGVRTLPPVNRATQQQIQQHVMQMNQHQQHTPTTGHPPPTNGFSDMRQHQNVSKDSDSESDAEPAKVEDYGEDWIMRCHCGMSHGTGACVECEKCGAWQHSFCMGLKANEDVDGYKCEVCMPRALKVSKAEAIRIQKKELEKQKKVNEKKAKTTKKGRRSTTSKAETTKKTPRAEQMKPPAYNDSNEYSRMATRLLKSLSPTSGAAALLEESKKNMRAKNMLVQEGVEGLVSHELIEARAVVCELTGYVCRPDECGRDIGGSLVPFVFQYDGLMKGPSGEDIGQPTGHELICIDTRKKGSAAKYVRRSCNPNCVLKHVLDDHATLGVMIVATRTIQYNTEISIPFDNDWRSSPYTLECADHPDDLIDQCMYERERRIVFPHLPHRNYPVPATSTPVSVGRKKRLSMSKAPKEEDDVVQSTPSSSTAPETKTPTTSRASRSAATAAVETEVKKEVKEEKPDDEEVPVKKVDAKGDDEVKKEESESPPNKKRKGRPSKTPRRFIDVEEKKQEKEKSVEKPKKEKEKTPVAPAPARVRARTGSPKKEHKELVQQELVDYSLPTDRNKMSREDRKTATLMAMIEKNEQMQRKKLEHQKHKKEESEKKEEPAASAAKEVKETHTPKTVKEKRKSATAVEEVEAKKEKKEAIKETKVEPKEEAPTPVVEKRTSSRVAKVVEELKKEEKAVTPTRDSARQRKKRESEMSAAEAGPATPTASSSTPSAANLTPPVKRWKQEAAKEAEKQAAEKAAGGASSESESTKPINQPPFLRKQWMKRHQEDIGKTTDDNSGTSGSPTKKPRRGTSLPAYSPVGKIPCSVLRAKMVQNANQAVKSGGQVDFGNQWMKKEDVPSPRLPSFEDAEKERRKEPEEKKGKKAEEKQEKDDVKEKAAEQRDKKEKKQPEKPEKQEETEKSKEKVVEKEKELPKEPKTPVLPPTPSREPSSRETRQQPVEKQEKEKEKPVEMTVEKPAEKPEEKDTGLPCVATTVTTPVPPLPVKKGTKKLTLDQYKERRSNAASVVDDSATASSSSSATTSTPKQGFIPNMDAMSRGQFVTLSVPSIPITSPQYPSSMTTKEFVQSQIAAAKAMGSPFIPSSQGRTTRASTSTVDNPVPVPTPSPATSSTPGQGLSLTERLAVQFGVGKLAQ